MNGFNCENLCDLRTW